ncbi:MAG: protein-L-isoaspartate(D-aspartate) O-methyltransferase [Dehalococcoidia bacterium]
MLVLRAWVRVNLFGLMEFDYTSARESLVKSLRWEISDERVLSAFARVPRECFVPPELRHYAYDDRPLPIGYGQTISQPLMVAIMTQALELKGDEKVLEVGTGSGYQAALLAELSREVITVERVPELAERAARTLRQLGYHRVKVHVAGDELGWPQDGPYDAIIVTAGAPRVPQSLVDQLAVDGRMAIPVGGRRVQELLVASKTQQGLSIKRMGECRFVPLISVPEGWPESEAYEEPASP